MNPAVRSSVAIGGGPISCRVTCKAEIDISYGGLTLTFQPEALREFLQLAGEALDDVDARFIAIRAQAV